MLLTGGKWSKAKAVSRHKEETFKSNIKTMSSLAHWHSLEKTNKQKQYIYISKGKRVAKLEPPISIYFLVFHPLNSHHMLIYLYLCHLLSLKDFDRNPSGNSCARDFYRRPTATCFYPWKICHWKYGRLT